MQTDEAAALADERVDLKPAPAKNPRIGFSQEQIVLGLSPLLASADGALCSA
jgi:hypothetical protein